MNRRNFLKLILIGLAAPARLGLSAGVARSDVSTAPGEGGYGFGDYGTEFYAGYAAFAPTLARGGD